MLFEIETALKWCNRRPIPTFKLARHLYCLPKASFKWPSISCRCENHFELFRKKSRSRTHVIVNGTANARCDSSQQINPMAFSGSRKFCFQQHKTTKMARKQNKKGGRTDRLQSSDAKVKRVFISF